VQDIQIWNNVFNYIDPQLTVQPSQAIACGAHNSSSTFRNIAIFNNTFRGGNQVVSLGDTNGTVENTVRVVNSVRGPNAGGINLRGNVQAIQTNNVTAPASAFVDMNANNFRLASGATTVIDKGTNSFVETISDKDADNVTRPQGSTWCAGAYEYVAGGPQPTPTPGPSPTPAPTATPSPTAGPSPPPVPPLLPGLSFEAEAMLVQAPFAEADGLVSQGVQTTNPSEGGKLTGRVSIPVAGDYRVAIKVNAPSTASDSIFVGFDQEPTPEAIFDIPPTSGIEERVVSWRGTGEPGAPEFSPKLWRLGAGTHTLYVIGREPRVQIDSLVISATAAPTPTPAPSATPTPQPSATPGPSVPPHRHTWDEIDGKPPSGTDDGAKNQERRKER
jgi:hypothetical protein